MLGLFQPRFSSYVALLWKHKPLHRTFKTFPRREIYNPAHAVCPPFLILPSITAHRVYRLPIRVETLFRSSVQNSVILPPVPHLKLATITWVRVSAPFRLVTSFDHVVQAFSSQTVLESSPMSTSKNGKGYEYRNSEKHRDLLIFKIRIMGKPCGV